MRLVTLKRSTEFQRVRGGARWSTPGLVVEAKRRAESTTGTARFGLTVTKKLGGAVVRNRLRRRLKSLLRALDPSLVRADADYVLVARPSLEAMSFAEIQAALHQALARVGSQLDLGSAGGAAARTAKARPSGDQPDRERPGSGRRDKSAIRRDTAPLGAAGPDRDS